MPALHSSLLCGLALLTPVLPGMALADEPQSLVRALDESLLHSVSKTVAANRAQALKATEALAVDAFANRLAIVGKKGFSKEDKPTGMTPDEAQRALLELEDARRERDKLAEQLERAETRSRGSGKEVHRLQGALATAAADRETLLQSLVATRRELARRDVELARCRADAAELEKAKRDEEAAAQSIAERAREAAGGSGGGGAPVDEAAAGRARMLQVQTLLEHERRVVRETREELRRDRALRTEAETVLRAAIADARRALEAERREVLDSLKSTKRAAPIAASVESLLPAAARSKLLADLLSREAILANLVGAVFPLGHQRMAEGAAAAPPPA